MANLQTLLASPDQSVRLKAALAAGTYPDPEYIEILIAQCAHEPDFFVRDTLTPEFTKWVVRDSLSNLQTIPFDPLCGYIRS